MNIIQVGLAATGAYILYSHYSRPASSTPSGTGQQPTNQQPVSTGGTTITTPSGTPSGTPLPTVTKTPLPMDDAINMAAAGSPEAIAQVRNANIQFTVDEWNWFRAAAGANPVDPSDMALLVTNVDNRDQRLTIDEYRARLARIGLGMVRRIRRANRWET